MKNTKRSFIASVMSLILCFAMLIGTTYAWFTDSVTSGKNKIIAGNLDVELLHTNKTVTTPTSVQDATDLFHVDLWEPGVIAYENFTVQNKGNLALKYTLQLTAWDYNTVKDTEKNLTDVIKVAIIDGTKNSSYTGTQFNGDREAAQLLDYEGFGTYKLTDLPLAAGAEKTFAVVLYWEPTENDNDYNLNNGKESSDGQPLYLEIGVNLVATQYTVEADSFDNQYDKSADNPALDEYIHEKATTTVAKSDLDTTGSVELKTSSSDPVQIKATVNNSVAKEQLNSIMSEAEQGTDTKLLLNLNVDTTDKKPTTVTYDISMDGIVTTTKDGKTTQKSGKISSVSDYVVVEMNIGTGLSDVKVTHSGKAMVNSQNVSDDTADFVGVYFYNPNTGDLILKTKTFSPFAVSFIRKNFEYDPNDSTRLIGLGDYKNDKVIMIPEGVKTIGGQVFNQFTGEDMVFNTVVEEIYLSSTVEKWEYNPQDNGYGSGIGPIAGCTSLKKVDMSKANMTDIHIMNIGDSFGLFAEMNAAKLPNLETVILPEKLTHIYKNDFFFTGDNVDGMNSKLTSLVIPTAVTTVDANAFAQCKITDFYWAINDFSNTNVGTQVRKQFNEGITIHVLNTSSLDSTYQILVKTDTNGNINIVKDYVPAN